MGRTAKRVTRARAKSGSDYEADIENRHFCSQPTIPDRELPADMDPRRLSFLRNSEKKWANGTRIRYYFFDRSSDGPGGSWVGPEAQKKVVRDAFQEWKDLGIGLEFQEVVDREDAEVRVGFALGDGSWSYLGRDVLDAAPDPNERTMNFGWNLATDYGHDTALHEIGHTLGAPHEHQNPYAGIEWDEPAVRNYFSGPPNNWNAATIDWNILRKLSPAVVTGSQWDPNSIMHYWFPAGLIRQPTQYAGGITPRPGLSEQDIEWVRKFYPPIEEEREPELRPYESQRLMIGPGEQVNFRIRPRFTRKYTLQTFGKADTLLALFEDVDGDPHFVDADDDSGTDRNARIRLRLYRGREYILRVRLYFSRLSGETAVFMW